MFLKNKKVKFVLVSLIILIFAFSSIAVGQSNKSSKLHVEYSKNGYSSAAPLVSRPREDFPPFDTNAQWLGVLEGSWYKIGEKLGKGVRDRINYTFDAWYSICEEQYGKDNTLSFLEKYEEQIRLFNPDFIDFMEGMAKGAKQGLAKSIYAEQFTDYEMVLLINTFSPMYRRLPEDAMDQIGATELERLIAIEEKERLYEEHNCTGVAFLPEATANGKLVTGRNTQAGDQVGLYTYAYIAKPENGKSFFTVAYAGTLTGLAIVNEDGVYLGHFAASGPDRAFAPPWYFLLANAAINSSTMEEAVELLTVGPKHYHTADRKILLCEGPLFWQVSDLENASVIERTARSYAVRYPGDHGEDGFIVCANNPYAEQTYDIINNLTDIPMQERMQLYDDGEHPKPGTFTRYWSLYWSAVYSRNRADTGMIKGHHFLAGHHWYDREGNKTEFVRTEDVRGADPNVVGEWFPVSHYTTSSTVCSHAGGWPDQYRHQVPTSTVFTPADMKVEFTQYNPCHWVGEWDSVIFYRVPHKGQGRTP
jgi:hypothetical protein